MMGRIVLEVGRSDKRFLSTHYARSNGIDMKNLKRRVFISSAFGALGASFLPLPSPGQFWTGQVLDGQQYKGSNESCWLDVIAPLVIDDADIGIRAEIVLTADTFIGVDGHAGKENSTEYEIYLYNAKGEVVGKNGVAERLTVPAMRTTVIGIRSLLKGDGKFYGGAKIRLRPRTPIPMHASDLFSSAYLRLTANESFDNVHANPDPIQLQVADSFFYSMPFPPLSKYDCFYSFFNPYDETSVGVVTVSDDDGKVIDEKPYRLNAHASLLFDLRAGAFVNELDGVRDDAGIIGHTGLKAESGGTIAITNRQGTVKNFGYLLIKQPRRMRFSIEHPIHQGPSRRVSTPAPFDGGGNFSAKNVLYTPLIFRSKKLGGITLNSRIHLSSGAPIEEYLWLKPLITNVDGRVVWQLGPDLRGPSLLSSKLTERGVLKLARQQSCILDCSQIQLTDDFAGGLALAIAPISNHTLMKVEITVPEWDAHAFTHFRPGLSSARAYQKANARGGIGTDYITSGARLQRQSQFRERDEMICVMNIDGRITGQPMLEIFGKNGLIERVQLDEVPPFATRVYILSDIAKLKDIDGDLTLRLVDHKSTLVMSIVHIDYRRRDIALDHGSDRFSTFQDFNCVRPAV
ncbi:hypothetical protein BH20ACI2_BH20ACI2_14880 [soil metagenome]